MGDRYARKRLSRKEPPEPSSLYDFFCIAEGYNCSMESMRRLGGVAQNQWGLFTTGQAERVGVSRLQLSRLAGAGNLERISQGVYRVVGAPSLEHEQIFAAWLVLDNKDFDPSRQPEAVVAGTAAARMHDIGDFWIESIDFYTPRRRSTRRPDVRTRVRALTRSEYTLVNGLPTLTAERTIVDLLQSGVDESLVVDALRDGSHRGIVSHLGLARALSALGGERNTAASLAQSLVSAANYPPPKTP